MDWTRKSGEKTETGAIVAGPGRLRGILVVTDGTNAITLDVHDNASAASGTKMIPTAVFTTSSVDRIQYIPLPDIGFENGMYATVTCSGTAKIEFYYRDN